MQKELEAGDKIQYFQDGKWHKGVIHGVRNYEDAATNMITRITYLVDTGRNERVDEYPFDHRDREINKRVNAMVSKGKPHIEALNAVLKHSDLPDNKPDVERVRQPEQIELPAEHIKPV